MSRKLHTVKSPHVVYKGAKSGTTDSAVPVLVVLQLPVGATVRTALRGPEKNRADRARVLSIESVDGLRRYQRAYSRENFKYEVGKLVKPAKPFDRDPYEDCGSGIHFYLRRREALRWVNIGLTNDDQLDEDLDSLNKHWDKKEVEYRNTIATLNYKIHQLQTKVNAVRQAIGG